MASLTQQGPIGASPQNLALYAYTRNNPIRLRDPDGRQTIGPDNSNGPRIRWSDFVHDRQEIGDNIAKGGPLTGITSQIAEKAWESDGAAAAHKIAGLTGVTSNAGNIAAVAALQTVVKINGDTGSVTVEKSASPGAGMVPVFRVEGAGNQRLVTGPTGALTIEGNQTLFLNFGDEGRAVDFLGQRLGQGYSDTAIKSFDVPQSFLDNVAGSAVPERLGRLFPTSPIMVDTTKATNQFGLRPPQIEALRILLGK